MTSWTDEDELCLSIAMALSKIKTKPRGPDRDDTYRRMVAEQIVKHLKRSNWICERAAAAASWATAQGAGLVGGRRFRSDAPLKLVEPRGPLTVPHCARL
jgi:hypothetical protein